MSREASLRTIRPRILRGSAVGVSGASGLAA